MVTQHFKFAIVAAIIYGVGCAPYDAKEFSDRTPGAPKSGSNVGAKADPPPQGGKNKPASEGTPLSYRDKPETFMQLEGSFEVFDTSEPTESSKVIEQIAFDREGRMYVAMTRRDYAVPSAAASVFRLKASGEIDPTFATTNFPGYGYGVSGLYVRPNGEVIVAGSKNWYSCLLAQISPSGGSVEHLLPDYMEVNDFKTHRQHCNAMLSPLENGFELTRHRLYHDEDNKEVADHYHVDLAGNKLDKKQDATKYLTLSENGYRYSYNGKAISLDHASIKEEAPSSGYSTAIVKLIEGAIIAVHKKNTCEDDPCTKRNLHIVRYNLTGEKVTAASLTVKSQQYGYDVHVGSAKGIPLLVLPQGSDSVYWLNEELNLVKTIDLPAALEYGSKIAFNPSQPDKIFIASGTSIYRLTKTSSQADEFWTEVPSPIRTSPLLQCTQQNDFGLLAVFVEASKQRALIIRSDGGIKNVTTREGIESYALSIDCQLLESGFATLEGNTLTHYDNGGNPVKTKEIEELLGKRSLHLKSNTINSSDCKSLKIYDAENDELISKELEEVPFEWCEDIAFHQPDLTILLLRPDSEKAYRETHVVAVRDNGTIVWNEKIDDSAYVEQSGPDEFLIAGIKEDRLTVTSRTLDGDVIRQVQLNGIPYSATPKNGHYVSLEITDIHSDSDDTVLFINGNFFREEMSHTQIIYLRVNKTGTIEKKEIYEAPYGFLYDGNTAILSGIETQKGYAILGQGMNVTSEASRLDYWVRILKNLP